MNLITLMNEYIITANNIYIDLRDNLEIFQKEAVIIDEAKCYLVNYANLDDFEYDGAYAYETSDGYAIVYDELLIDLKTSDKQIVDYDVYYQ